MLVTIRVEEDGKVYSNSFDVKDGDEAKLCVDYWLFELDEQGLI